MRAKTRKVAVTWTYVSCAFADEAEDEDWKTDAAKQYAANNADVPMMCALTNAVCIVNNILQERRAGDRS